MPVPYNAPRYVYGFLLVYSDKPELALVETEFMRKSIANVFPLHALTRTGTQPRNAWTDFVSPFPVRFDGMDVQEVSTFIQQNIRARTGKPLSAPCVLARIEEGAYTLLLNKKQLKGIGSDISAFREALQDALFDQRLILAERPSQTTSHEIPNRVA